MFGEIGYLNRVINNIDPPEISQSLISRFLCIFDEVEKIYDTKRVKPKACKRSLGYKLCHCSNTQLLFVRPVTFCFYLLAVVPEHHSYR